MTTVIKPGDVFKPKQRELFQFARCPRGLLRSPLLSAGAKLCWCALVDCDTPNGCFPGHHYLADALGISVPTLKRHLRELRVTKLIRIESGPNRRNRYLSMAN
jgi:hypothetical protein